MKIYSFMTGYEHDGDVYNSYHTTKDGATKAMFKYVEKFVPNAKKETNRLGDTIFKNWDATYYVDEIEVIDD